MEKIFKTINEQIEILKHRGLKVENEIKSQISYYFTEKNGESQQGYLDNANYNYITICNICLQKDFLKAYTQGLFNNYHILLCSLS